MDTAKSFGSDNHAGVHPRILEAINRANGGRVPAYGADALTAAAEARFKEVFGAGTAVSFVFNGTAANVLCLRTVTDRYHAVLCADGAHLANNECGAPEHILGCRLITIPTRDGKLEPAEVQRRLKGFGDPHASQPRVLSISQATELGTVYTVPEIRALADLVHRHGMLLHMDGARIVNAAAALGLGLRECTRDAGVDLLSFGGTKAGMLFGEAVLVFNPEHAKALEFYRKQNLQLASKMRFISAQFLALLEGDLWRETATHANAMARLLAEEIEGAPGVKLAAPVQTNGVFARVPAGRIPALQKVFPFYVWDEEKDADGAQIVRWMTAFDTDPADVKAFAAAVRG